jgi:uncharacterized protein
VAFFVSDINIEKALQRDVAKTILNWTTENECKLIISAQGIVPSPPSNSRNTNVKEGNSKQEDINHEDSKNSTTSTSTSPPALTEIYAVTSTESAARLVMEHKNYLTHLRDGTLTGIPSILLNEGVLTNLDVIVFLVNVLPNIPDFHAAAIVSEAISRIVPNLSCDIRALMIEAQIIENRMMNVRAEQKRISYIA